MGDSRYEHVEVALRIRPDEAIEDALLFGIGYWKARMDRDLEETLFAEVDPTTDG